MKVILDQKEWSALLGTLQFSLTMVEDLLGVAKNEEEDEFGWSEDMKEAMQNDIDKMRRELEKLGSFDNNAVIYAGTHYGRYKVLLNGLKAKNSK